MKYSISILLLTAVLLISLSGCKTMSEEDQGKLYAKVLVLYDNRDFKTAVPILRSLIKADRRNTIYLFTLTKCYYQLGDKEKAFTNIRTLYKRSPDNPDITIMYAELLLEKQENKRALALLRRVLLFDRYNIQANYILGMYYFNKADYEKSQFYFSHFEQTENALIQTYIQLSLIYFDIDEVENAVGILEKAHALSRNKEEKERIDKIIKDYKK